MLRIQKILIIFLEQVAFSDFVISILLWHETVQGETDAWRFLDYIFSVNLGLCFMLKKIKKKTIKGRNISDEDYFGNFRGVFSQGYIN